MARKLFSMENEELILSFDNVKEDVADSYEEINDALDGETELKDDLNVLDTSLSSIDNINTTVDIIEDTIDSGGDVSETSYQLVQESIKVFYKTINYQPTKTRTTLEDLTFEELDPTSKTKVTLEDIKETLKSIWQRIENFFKGLKQKLSNFWLKLTDSRERLLERGKKFYDVFLKFGTDKDKYTPTNKVTVKIPSSFSNDPIGFFRIVYDFLIRIESNLRDINKQTKITKEAYERFKTDKTVNNKDIVLKEIETLNSHIENYPKEISIPNAKELNLVDHVIDPEDKSSTTFVYNSYENFSDVYKAYAAFNENGETLDDILKQMGIDLDKENETLKKEDKTIDNDEVKFKDRLNVWWKMQQVISKTKTTGLMDALRITGFAYTNIAKLAPVKFKS